MNASTFVLVPGAWHGGWVWNTVAARLRAQGHRVTTPTLSGMGDRRREATADIGLPDHIDDLEAHLFMEDLDDVVLVGWSYGSFVAAGAAARMPGKVRAIIYLDAIVPSSGCSVADYAAPATKDFLATLAAESRLLAPIPFDVFGVTDADVIAHVQPRLVDQPPRTFLEPMPSIVGIEAIAQAYVHCKRTNIPSVREGYEGFRNAGRGKVIELDVDHHCMLTAPEETVRALIECLP